MDQVRYEVKGTGFSFELPDPVNSAAIDVSARPVNHFHGTMLMMESVGRQQREVAQDANLTDIGKTNKLAPQLVEVWNMVSDTYAAIDAMEADLASRTAALEAVPQLHDTASAVAVEDREARDWWRAQSVQARTKILDQIANDEAAHKKYERLQIALLRSPIPLPDMEISAVRTLWQQLKRIENPAEAQAIDQGHRTIEWTRRAAAHLQAIANHMTGWDKDKLADFLVQDDSRLKVARHLDVTHQHMLMAKSRRAAKARAA
jgi:hypothetical protein